MIAPNDPPAVAWSLEALARELVDARVLGDPATLVRGVRHDSRAVRPGDLFVARKGEKLDGLSFVPAAIAADIRWSCGAMTSTSRAETDSARRVTWSSPTQIRTSSNS